uniref:tRNA pseudouridine synthase n=1 Tax=Bursaphelenchus xylophilus TaxID=6326 RepID=A0A1I7S3X8_BURXY
MADGKKKEFDFSRYPERRIALLFLYFGWEHDGLVTQPNMPNTVEEVLLNALIRTKLIRSRDCGLNRCGRTDKGVSGFRQVCSLIVRSTDINGEGLYWKEESARMPRIVSTKELDYVKILNAVLPASIRVLAWSPCLMDFNARFNCSKRYYTYVFPKNGFDIEKMKIAASYLVGSHDFRNFCRIDNNKARLETSYVREIFEMDIKAICGEPDGPYKMYQLSVSGSGFLWHMVRCVVGVLFEVGLQHEEPSVVKELLDIENCSARPQYQLAKDTPLCFFDCNYNQPLEWKFDVEALRKVFCSLEKSWIDLKVKCDMIRAMMNEISGMIPDGNHNAMEEYIRDAPIPKKVVPMMKRPRCESLAARKEKMDNKKSKMGLE